MKLDALTEVDFYLKRLSERERLKNSGLLGDSLFRMVTL